MRKYTRDGSTEAWPTELRSEEARHDVRPNKAGPSGDGHDEVSTSETGPVGDGPTGAEPAS